MLSEMEFFEQFFVKNYIYILKVLSLRLKHSTDYFDIFYITVEYILTT